MRSLWIRSKVSKMADSLTDEQLVGELRRYGETVSLPIKPNKRPILIKKLNHLRSRNKSPQQKGKGKQPAQRRQSNMGAFSSDDSDAELDPTPGPSRSEGSTRRSLEQSTPSKITEVVTRSLRRRPNVGPLSVTVGRGRRPTDAVQAGLLATPGGSTALSSGKWRRRGLDDAPETDEMSPNGSSYRSPRLYPDISAQRVTARDSSFSDRSTIPFESSESDVEGSSYEVANKSVNTSFTLTRGGRSPASNHVSPSRQSFETNHTFYRRGLASHSRLRRRFYPEHVSFGLVALVLAFFVVIFFGYMFVRKELFMGWLFMTTSAEGNYKNLLCSEENKTNCFTQDEVRKATIVIKDLYADLSARKGRVLCGDAKESEQHLAVESLKRDHLQMKGLPEALLLLLYKQETQKLFNCCIELILANPRWNLRALTKDGTEAKNVSEVEYLESAVASMGFLCRLQRSFSRVMWSLFVLLAGVASLGMVLVLLWWRIQAKEREEQRVFAMVEQIIDLLKEQHEIAQNEDNTEQSGLAVQHVRDQLLPPSRRKAMQKIWEKAVKFIEANESRVRLETQIIEGEEFTVWRWIQAAPNGGKVWQGQAFGEHNENNASTAIYSPTPCLKIRNMFDKEVESEDDWEENVKDALLEKCKDIHSLVHVYVDSSSREGCVYVKCSSKEAAGKVKQSLHGWWFDGRLVTVKHLKVEHYHHRWPEAKFAWRPLQPSTNQMRSLAQPYHRSSLEMT